VDGHNVTGGTKHYAFFQFFYSLWERV
jgi:hypothetical protein